MNTFEKRTDHFALVLNSKKHGTKECLIDFDDFDRVKGMVWGLNNTGYASTNIGNASSGFHSTILLHRFILSFPDLLVDHANQNKLDNRKTNLRVCNRSENRFNTKARADNKLGIKGVSFIENRYEARIFKDGKNVRLGRFKDINDAVAARKIAEVEIHGEFRSVI